MNLGEREGDKNSFPYRCTYSIRAIDLSPLSTIISPLASRAPSPDILSYGLGGTTEGRRELYQQVGSFRFFPPSLFPFSHVEEEPHWNLASHKIQGTQKELASHLPLENYCGEASQKLEGNRRIIASLLSIENQHDAASHLMIENQGLEASHRTEGDQTTLASYKWKENHRLGASPTTVENQKRKASHVIVGFHITKAVFLRGVGFAG